MTYPPSPVLCSHIFHGSWYQLCPAGNLGLELWRCETDETRTLVWASSPKPSPVPAVLLHILVSASRYCRFEDAEYLLLATRQMAMENPNA